MRVCRRLDSLRHISSLLEMRDRLIYLKLASYESCRRLDSLRHDLRPCSMLSLFWLDVGSRLWQEIRLVQPVAATLPDLLIHNF